MTTTKKQASPFKLDVEEDGFAIVTIDVVGETQNTLKAEFSGQFDLLIEEIKSHQSLKAVIITSGKENSFIAGADITMLEAASTEEEAKQMSKTGHATFAKLETLNMPVVAAIHGACLGGGLELALACSGRVCSDEDVTRLGLPEVQLGLLPGGGGTQRLPRQIGIANALDLMLTGRQLRPKQARKLGLIDEVVARSHLLTAAKAVAVKLLSVDSLSSESFLSISGLQKLALEKNQWGRQILFEQARKKLLKKTGGHYPAPEYIIDAVEIGAESGFEKGLQAEADLFAKLVVSPQAKQLMNIFFAVTALKKSNGLVAKKSSKNEAVEVEEKDINQIAVLGAGLMGAGITYTAIEKAGVNVRLKDRDNKGLSFGLKYINQLYSKLLKKRRLSKAQHSRKMSMLTATTNYSGFANVDMVIEAVFEDLKLKQAMLKDVEENCSEDTIFATNTSSIPITKIARVSKHPETVLGLHYFSPVEKMPLLEIVRTKKTADWVIASAVKFGKKQGKTVIVVNDGPGFYTSRILAPYINEAGYMIAEGVPIESIDKALKNFGFPVGPITLLDEVGIDVGTKIAPILEKAFGERMTPPPEFAKLTEADRKGRKNGKGFYQYDSSGKSTHEVDDSIYQVLGINNRLDISTDVIAERCVLQMINEAAHCLSEKIVTSPADADIGAIFGLGFPPFLGGPFRYMEEQGIAIIIERLKHYQKLHGDRFMPAKILEVMASKNKRFY